MAPMFHHGAEHEFGAIGVGGRGQAGLRKRAGRKSRTESERQAQFDKLVAETLPAEGLSMASFLEIDCGDRPGWKPRLAIRGPVRHRQIADQRALGPLSDTCSRLHSVLQAALRHHVIGPGPAKARVCAQNSACAPPARSRRVITPFTGGGHPRPLKGSSRTARCVLEQHAGQPGRRPSPPDNVCRTRLPRC